jgi:hypothetical protein
VTARRGSFRLPLQRLTVELQWSSTVARARPGSRGVGVPFRGPAVTRVALSWFRALPPRRSRRPRGLPRATSLPRPKPRKTLSWSSLLLQSRAASRLPALRYRRDPLAWTRRPVEPGNRLSWGSCSPRAHVRRVPLVAPTPVARSREGEGYQALTGAVLRVLAPLDGSGCTRGTHASLAGPAVRRGAPTLRGLVPYRSRPLESPYRAFPSRGAVPALAGLFSLVSSRRLPNGAARSEGFAAPFADRADLSPQLARGPTGLKKPGRRVPGVARASHVSRCRGRLRRLVSERPGSPDSAARTLTSELDSPRESVRGF